jgi:ribosomal protein S18 acetylase RimI-like enzyme
MNRFEVRNARAADAPAVRTLMVRVIEHDYGYPYRSRFHADVDDPGGFYLADPRHALVVAIDGPTGELVGCAGVRTLAITAPPHPPELLARYDRERSAELTRVFVAPEHRRRGIARALVEAARARVAAIGGYDVLCFHSRTAVEFWRSIGSREVLDARRPGVAGPAGGSVYFELPLGEAARPGG